MEKWYIVQTRPRWEKKIVDCLRQRGIESYCPVKKVKRKWSDRVKTMEEPIFRSCILVKISPHQKTHVRLLNGVVNFVYHNAKPVQVKEKEIQMLRKMAEVLDDGSRSKPSVMQEYKKQQKSLQAYLDTFDQWVKAALERPKLA